MPTADIRESVEFYERLGFTQAQTGDAWPHPYGVLTDGDIVLGLHQQPAREAAVTFVRPDVARHAGELERAGYALEYRRTGAEEFHEVGLRDPAGQLVVALEARTYSPSARESRTSLCGEFAALALPARDFEAARRYWEPLGFVAGEEDETPFEHLTAASDALDIVFHRLRALAGPTLIFTDPDPPAAIARLREAGVALAGRAPPGLDPAASAVFEAPEGTRLLLLGDDLRARLLA